MSENVAKKKSAHRCCWNSYQCSVFGCCFRDLVAKESNLELVLTKAFLEVDKALQKDLHFSPNGRFIHITCTKIYFVYAYTRKYVMTHVSSLFKTLLIYLGFEALDFPTDMTWALLVRGLSFNPKLLNNWWKINQLQLEQTLVFHCFQYCMYLYRKVTN